MASIPSSSQPLLGQQFFACATEWYIYYNVESALVSRSFDVGLSSFDGGFFPPEIEIIKCRKNNFLKWADFAKTVPTSLTMEGSTITLDGSIALVVEFFSTFSFASSSFQFEINTSENSPLFSM